MTSRLYHARVLVRGLTESSRWWCSPCSPVIVVLVCLFFSCLGWPWDFLPSIIHIANDGLLIIFWVASSIMPGLLWSASITTKLFSDKALLVPRSWSLVFILYALSSILPNGILNSLTGRHRVDVDPLASFWPLPLLCVIEKESCFVLPYKFYRMSSSTGVKGGFIYGDYTLYIRGDIPIFSKRHFDIYYILRGP